MPRLQKRKPKKWNKLKLIKSLSRRRKAPGEQVVPNKKKERKIKHKKKEEEEWMDS